jgi:Protein of unknown function (DUF3102)
MTNTVTKEQILAEYDELRKTLKHTVVRDQLMDTHGPGVGWSRNRIYTLIQNERPAVTSGPFARTQKVKPTPATPVVPVQNEINNLHSEIVGLAQKALDNALRIGELLTAKKAELAHGEFLPWLKKHVNFGPDAAERYRIVYERRDELPLKEVKTLTQALKLLKKSNDLVVAPDPVVKRGPKNPDETKLEVESAEKEKEQLLQKVGIVIDAPKVEVKTESQSETIARIYAKTRAGRTARIANAKGILSKLIEAVREI